MKAIIRIALLCAVLQCGACGTTVHMTGTWKAPEAPEEGFHNILVASLTSNLTAQQVVETQMAGALQKKGISAGKGLEMFPPKFNPVTDQDKNSATQKLIDAGYTAVLTTSLINKEAQSRYVPGSVSYAPYPAYGWYGRFWGYYGYMYGAVYSPGYYTTDKKYFLESNLYDLKQDGKLVWSGQSETYNPSSLESFAKYFSVQVTDALDHAGLLKK